MVLSRLRLGEWATLVFGVLLFLALFLDWLRLEEDIGLVTFTSGSVEETGWAGLGWPIVLMLVGEIGLALAVAVTTLVRHPVAWAVGAAVTCTGWGIVTTLVLLVRLALAQPDLGGGLPDAAVDVTIAAHLGLLLTALVPFASWLAMGDERTDAPESAYAPPPARPLPEV